MSTSTTPPLSDKLVPPVDSDDLKAAWEFPQELQKLALRGTNDLSILRPELLASSDLVRLNTKSKEYLIDIYHRWLLLIRIAEFNKDRRMELPGMENGKPTQAIIGAQGADESGAPRRNSTNDSLPIDMEELIQLIEKEKGPKS